METFVVGANGRAGVQLVKSLIKAGHRVIAASRHLDHLSKAENLSTMEFDLHAPVKDLATAIGHPDVIYFVAGNLKDLLQTDAFGAVKVMEVAKLNQIKRFVLLSGGFVPAPQVDSLLEFEGNGADADAKYPGIMNYSAAKFFAENYLINQTELDYTILKPFYIKEGSATGKIEIDQGSAGSITYADLGQTMADLLHYPNTIGKAIKLNNGTTPIHQALDQL